MSNGRMTMVELDRLKRIVAMSIMPVPDNTIVNTPLQSTLKWSFFYYFAIDKFLQEAGRSNGRTTPTELDRLKRDVSLAALAKSQNRVLTTQGKDFAVLCLFHTEKSPSLAKNV